MDIESLMSIVGLSSLISLIVNAIISYIMKKKMIKFTRRTEEIQSRYHDILANMLVVLDVKNLIHVDLSHKRIQILDSMSTDEIHKHFYDQVNASLVFAHVYASDSVLEKLQDFITNPTKKKYKETAKAMRKDLWD